MGVFDTKFMIDQFSVYFPPEWLKATLVLSIISTWVLVALFAYLNQYTQRRYFSLWTIAWLFYALWLTASINLLDSPESQLGQMLTQSCIGVCALFLVWGNVTILRQDFPQRNILGVIVIVLLWSYIGMYQLHDPFWLKLPLFLLLGMASAFTSYLFFVRRRQRRYIGASILSLGFLLFGLYLTAYPFIYSQREFAPSGFLLSSVVQLVIAFGMIVLVLEEVRYESRTVRGRLRQDVKRTRVLEKEVVASEDKYRTLFDNASDALFIVDQDTLGILETNEAGCSLVGLTADQVISRTLLEICPSLSAQRVALIESPQRFREVLESTDKLIFPRPDGTNAVAEGRAMPLQYAGRPAIQVCLRDLSDRTKLEQRVRQAEKLSALCQLISGVAHELNNPLAIIMGRAQLLMVKNHLDTKFRADISLMNHESERASRIVQRLLAFARPQPPRKEFIQVNDLIQQVVDLLCVDPAAQQVRVVAELDPAVPRTMADDHQLEQVLMNLTQNARHAIMDKNSGVAGLIRVRTEVIDKIIRILVIDNGSGILPQNLSKIFDPFFTTKPFGVGTGLGLSICYSILQEHGGNLLVQSEVGKGTTFIMELPILAEAPRIATLPITSHEKPNQRIPMKEMQTAPSKQSPPTPIPEPVVLVAAAKPNGANGPGNGNGRGNGNDHAAHPPSVGASNNRKPSILLVDDEPAIAGVLCELLSASDYEVESASNGRQALEVLGKHHFDLIISDLKMPGMDGRELYRNLQEHHPALAKRVIFLTGDTVSGDTREFLDSLGTPWLSKPFNIADVEETVRVSLEKAGVLPAA